MQKNIGTKPVFLVCFANAVAKKCIEKNKLELRNDKQDFGNQTN